MTAILVTIHVAVCIFLILVVLLQTGKGAEMGVSMGGAGSQALFGAAGPANILTKITTAVAIIFMITSLSLAYMSGHQSQSSVMKAPPASAAQEVPAAE
ncbi:preprotein translocase subunit SecG [uncultured Desulfobacter sp.]|uniref:preprotein translocase subunit SecG n=1 Tax=uncultured Desulfobacter sp. TaxID=240139 RepID=UPI0029F4D381|nr:preprotein translocase subunit SecG [uncultured Desulfobacter sp.]